MQREDAFSSKEEEWADNALERATDLMQLAIGRDQEDPTDELTARLVKEGIIAMAHMLFSTGGEDRENIYSPYSSERLGSYSYSKAQRAVAGSLDTGVPEFDTAVKMFNSTSDGVSAFSITSEEVFKSPFTDTVGAARDPILQPDAWNV